MTGFTPESPIISKLQFLQLLERLPQKQRQLMQQYFELMDWQGLKLPSAERRQRDSLKIFEKTLSRSVERLRYVLRKNSQHLVKSSLQQDCYQPSAINRVQIQERETQAKRNLDEER